MNKELEQEAEINYLKKNIESLNSLIAIDLEKYKKQHEKFQKEKIEFAIKQLKNIYDILDLLPEYFAERQKFEINCKIQELQKQLNELA